MTWILGMSRFLLRRLLVMVPLLIGITFIVFVVMNLAPGDPFAELRMNPSFSPDTVAALEREFGFGQPFVVLGTSGMASLMRLMRGQILAIRDADFVRTARAKGVPERWVVWKHILRNALNPFITLAGYEIGTLLSGAALVEAVMNLQG